MKKLFCFVSVLCTLTFAQKVACVGNSLTYTSYPAYLNAKITATVERFGVPGATMLKAHPNAYWNTTTFVDVQNWNPEYTIILLGTNDTGYWNSTNAILYGNDYRDFLTHFSGHIYLGIIPYAMPLANQVARNQDIDEANAIVRQIATDYGLKTIDFQSALKPEHYCSDGIHMNLTGQEVMAQVAYDVIKADLPTVPADIIPPAIPTGLSATAGDGYVSLSWNANTEPDMKNYHIFRRTSPTGQEVYIASPLKSLTTYTDNSVTNGTTYYYQICAVDESNNRSQLCNMVSATPISNNPSKPTGLTATALPGAILLSWNANPESDITNYRIFKGTATNSIPYFYSLSATETSFQDNNVEFGTTYFYKINVKNDKGYYSPFSSIVSASPELLDVTPPSAPQNLTGYSDGLNIYLDWDDNTESDLNNYWVYRAIPGLAWNQYAYRGKTISNYTDVGVSLSTTYSYRISAVDNSINESSYSNVVNIRHQYPRVAVNINSVWSGIDNNAIIDWDEHAEYWIDKYEIYRKTDQQTDFSLIITLNHPTSSYNDHNLVAGTTYYYKLKAIDLIGDISGESPRSSVKIFSPPTSIAFTVTIEEDGNYTFQSSDFSFYDADGHSFSGITITQPPSINMNTIKHNQSNLLIGTTISDFTKLRFLPTPDESGSPYVKFKYKVMDSSGDISNSEYSVTINVTPINDGWLSEKLTF